jgi:hypothetical protein
MDYAIEPSLLAGAGGDCSLNPTVTNSAAYGQAGRLVFLPNPIELAAGPQDRPVCDALDNDVETAFQYNFARCYDPSPGRWLLEE